MRKALTTFGNGWFEITPTKITPEDRDALLNLYTSDEDRDRIRSAIQNRSISRASYEDSRVASDLLSLHHQGEFTRATVILPYGRGFVVFSGRWIRF
jgi:hypothetical protein